MQEEKLQQLISLGVKVPGNPGGEIPEEYQDNLKLFLEGIDFMRLGQAVNRKQWESAMMTIRRMEQRSDTLGLSCIQKSFSGIRQAVVRKDAMQAKQLLAGVIQRRVKLLQVFAESEAI